MAALPLPNQPHRRRLLAALVAGVRVHSRWGAWCQVYSPRSRQIYAVTREVDGAAIRWTCPCRWTVLHGAWAQYNVGTTAAHSNHVPPCAHVMVAVIARLSPDAQRDLFVRDAALGLLWDSAHRVRVPMGTPYARPAAVLEEVAY